MDNKWVAIWGNAISRGEYKPEMYGKDFTLRYPVTSVFDGDKLRFHFSGICNKQGSEITKACISHKDADDFTPITFNKNISGTIPAGGKIISDEIDFNVKRGDTLYVTMYFGEITELMSCVVSLGPLSDGAKYAMGDLSTTSDFPIESCNGTSMCYFLETVDILTDAKNRALIAWGDSITAQSWPEFLTLRILEKGYENCSVVKRGVSGTRVLGQYDCVPYAHYGLKGKNRFLRECEVSGAEAVVILQGINDIIHPDGKNPFRPMSNLPAIDELKDGLRYYINTAHGLGLKAYLATLTPIEGWRTYKDFREEMRNEINAWIRNNDEADGYIDFDMAIRDENNKKAMRSECDSGDHLHPNREGGKAMAWSVPDELIK